MKPTAERLEVATKAQIEFLEISNNIASYIETAVEPLIADSRFDEAVYTVNELYQNKDLFFQKNHIINNIRDAQDSGIWKRAFERKSGCIDTQIKQAVELDTLILQIGKEAEQYIKPIIEGLIANGSYDEALTTLSSFFGSSRRAIIEHDMLKAKILRTKAKQ